MRESKLLVENFSSQTENAGYVSRAELSCEQTTRGGIGEGGATKVYLSLRKMFSQKLTISVYYVALNTISTERLRCCTTYTTQLLLGKSFLMLICSQQFTI